MKRNIVNVIVTVCIAATVLLSCEENEVASPVVTNIRVIEKDSTITGAEFNQTIAIQGSNLGSVRAVMFNDVTVIPSPVYVTDNNIIIAVPDAAPKEVTNKITLVTASGEQVSIDFNVVLPPPEITALYNEFGIPGEENKVLGSYFFLITKVLVGSTEAEIVSFTDSEVTFVMPQDVTTSTVTVVGAGGETTSTFRTHETDGRLINFDIPATGWGSDVCWGDAERIDPDNSELPVISGRYSRIKQTDLPATGYNGSWVISTCYFDFGLPAASHEDKYFKMEVNVVESWKAGYYVIDIGIDGGDHFKYKFKPWDTDTYRTTGLKTEGWKTFYIPLSDFYKYNGDTQADPIVRISDISKIRDVRVDFSNGAEDATVIASHYVALDNLRIVDK
ncbi:glycan-binding surface protein [Ohtaekwangia koreensis]|uniref:Surface glycan-binding protein B xyloglucan binding domain-containing protein n=1 Tax=Ohtaekwangia koreensis TaxID=688867 RepID=A0A1T5MGW7_9BACT|nr:glycan-binding surface protein [Ohtaekwangia koreensis]SKC87491.1 hypothetical protein SAMN05660236_5435 [Ohtaekwangia koreensis]